MTLLITGGAGFIGSNFIHWMLAYHDYRLINLDALTYAGNLENLTSLEGNLCYKFVHGRIENVELLEEIVKDEGIDTIVHFAAESHVDRSILDSAPFIKTNVEGTRVLLEIARIHKIKRFIHISTDEVYGSLGETGFFTEMTPLAPNSPYSASKAASDLMVRAYRETYGLPAIIIRCSNNYGPYQFPEKFIPLVLTNLLADEVVPLYGDGLNVRDWIYVEDFCRAIDLILHQGAVGEVYNVGGKSEKNNKEVAQLLARYLNKPDSLITHVQDRLGHDRRYAMDITKIYKELGWCPQYSFEEGIQKTIAWYQENRQWWQRIKSGEYTKYYEEMYGKKFKEDML